MNEEKCKHKGQWVLTLDGVKCKDCNYITKDPEAYKNLYGKKEK